MSKILRVGLAQIAVHAAYYATSNSLMAEPTGHDIGIDKLSHMSQIKALRNGIYERYLRHIEQKVTSVISTAKEHHVSLLIFPEYSIPAELLVRIKAMILNSGLTVVAGTHMVTTKYAETYASIGLKRLITKDDMEVQTHVVRMAIAPVLFPDGTATFVSKGFESQWEASLVTSDARWDWVNIENGDYNYQLGIKICIDALQNGIPSLGGGGPRLLAIPSMSPKTTFFDSPAAMYLHQEIPVCYVNDAVGGNSKVFGWCHREQTNPFLNTDGTIAIPAGEEALLIADVDLEGQFGKNSTVHQHEPLKIVALIPLMYANDPSQEEIHSLLCKETLSENECTYIIEEQGNKILLTQKLRILASMIETGIARAEDYKFFKEVLYVDTEEPLWRIEYDFLEQLQRVLASLVVSTVGDAAVDILQTVKRELQSLKGAHVDLTSVAIPRTVDPDLTSGVSSHPYIGRDASITVLRSFVNSTDHRVAIVSGMRGIGKTEFLRDGVNQVLPANWRRITVPMTAGTGFNRFILSLCNQVRIRVSETDLMEMDSVKQSRLIEAALQKFFDIQSACLLIDDWHHVLSKRGYADDRFAEFLSRASEYSGGSNNKIILTSQIRINSLNIRNIFLKPLETDAIRGIMDWNIRVTRGNSSPVDIPEELVERVHGNPLAATLMSQLIDKFPVGTILENTKVKERFQDRLIPMLLEHIELTTAERAFAQYMSIFNTPVEMEAIEVFAGDDTSDLVESLTDYFILQFDIESGSYIMHPLIRDFFVRETEFSTLVDYHKLAADYYGARSNAADVTPNDKAEHVAHLAASMQWDEATELKYLYIDELRPVALSLFKARQYDTAVRYYQVLDQLREDPDVKFHLALCYGHQLNWPSTEKAIAEAMELAPDAWWILSGYGDILCKKRHLHDAEKYLNQALEVMGRTPGLSPKKYSAVYQSLGSVYEAFGLDKAQEYYLRAIASDPDSAFAHYHYAKYLYKVKHDAPTAMSHLATAKDIDSSLRQLHVLESQIKVGATYEPDEDSEVDNIDTEDEEVPVESLE